MAAVFHQRGAIKLEIMRLSSSRHPDAPLTYPNPMYLYWAKAPWGWVLIDMKDQKQVGNPSA